MRGSQGSHADRLATGHSPPQPPPPSPPQPVRDTVRQTVERAARGKGNRVYRMAGGV